VSESDEVGEERPSLNVMGEPLAPCSTDPMTGFFRDGCCETGRDDLGRHVVCAEVTAEFLDYSRSQGNDLSTPRPELGFPGLEPGDRWCLCADRWAQAADAGVAPPVVLRSTHEKAAEVIDLALLKRFALDLM